jgi:hypothetical protein
MTVELKELNAILLEVTLLLQPGCLEIAWISTRVEARFLV